MYTLKRISREYFNLIIVASLIFFSSFLLPFFIFEDLSDMKEVIRYASDTNVVDINNKLFSTILFNNLYANILLISGSFAFGITTITNLIVNGFTFGSQMIFVFQNGVSIKNILLLILPHGILEIPALLIAGAIGFKVPFSILNYFRDKRKTILSKIEIKDAGYLILIIFLLVFFAAIIETNITIPYAKSLL